VRCAGFSGAGMTCSPHVAAGIQKPSGHRSRKVEPAVQRDSTRILIVARELKAVSEIVGLDSDHNLRVIA
jgi:hypothetical protein